jgi:hypothetical protein
MANSRDFTGKNRKFTGTKGITVSKGTTGQRVGSESGELRFNTTTELMEYYDGTTWKPIDAPPSIASVTTSDSVGTNTVLNADGSTLYTITINGGNFGAGVNVQFIGSTGTTYTAGNITRVSASQITCTTLSSMGTTDDPYDVKVTNVSGLSIESLDAFSYNAPPVFVSAAGQIGTVFDGQTISGTTLNAGATDAESNTITYSIISGSLPGSGLTISSSTGAITGTLSGSPSLGNYSFVVRASTTEGVAERQFTIQVVANPFISATGGTVVTSGDYKIHTFTSSSDFIVTNAGSPAGSNTVDYLVIAGGGSAGEGGGGAGGFRESKSPTAPWTASPLAASTSLPVSATTYPITVGGAATPSVFSTITSSAGGGQSGSGGSGGGSGRDQPGGQGGGNSPPVSPPQGTPGGPSSQSSWSGSGGGGGASQPGGTSQGGSPGGERGGPGGNGTSTSITGSSTNYAGGGGGYSSNNIAAPGGTGGGGSSPGQPGSSNTGGGGGGGSGAGGSGIVIIRYKFQ